MNVAFANEYNLDIKWRANGAIHNLNKSHSGCLKHVRFEENIVILNEGIQENLSVSVRKLVAEVGMYNESARRIIKIDRRLLPCEMSTSEQHSNTDNERRLRFCQ